MWVTHTDLDGNPSLPSYQTFSTTSGPRRRTTRRVVLGLCACELRSKDMLDVKRHLFFSKTILDWAEKYKVTLLPHLGELQMLFFPKPWFTQEVFHFCSMVPTACRLHFQVFTHLVELPPPTTSVSFKAIFPLDITLLDCIPLHQK